ncbi:uncharacterized protein HMPREF1541_01925 [Cyphellophora europaea CBS 101466]|uniref:Uncharacterized protein n=1 Tax=Cyphellophora europaea (strain CBS 101466) TaxID=1220924 RepID=W2S264_CYPE1|nr:uncharacterized protein HMPREF1541_01925 [Cyphellophora europaea CBS 101466]ETN42767.1 hypothetical protein HMPREF1541_01925 [Cyphellophora europaea CBS 101466]
MLHVPVLAVVAALLQTGLASQPDAPKPYAAPLRDLRLGSVNFLHTTDTHGWHAGHLLEPSYAADWGDYIDFAGRMREKLEADGRDLLLVDTGDRIEGNGLYDASKPRGKYTFDIFKEQNIDLICSGNHELYKVTSASDEYNITVPAYKDSYLASNLDIFDPVKSKFVPLAAKFKKFTTKKQGVRIMSFGFIYNFQRNGNNTRVRPVKDTIQEPWFQEAIRDKDVDLFVVIGHSAVRSEEFDAIYKAIRSVKWDIPIHFFGGHFHIRDYRRYDSKAYGLASGRFMETIGFASIDGVSAKSKSAETLATPSFFRRYIDNNLFSFYHHSSTNASNFHSPRGKNVSSLIQHSRSALDLDHIYGCAPTNLWMARSPFPSNQSIYTWLNETVLPALEPSEQTYLSKPRLILLNTGAIRFDIFAGAFTRDSTFIVSPFTSTMRHIPAIPYSKAKQLVAILNSAGQIFLQATDGEVNPADLGPPMQRGRNNNVLAGPYDTSDLPAKPQSGIPAQKPLESDHERQALQPGYTTTDDGGTDGDDTVHSPISFYRVPNVVQSTVNPAGGLIPDDTPVDVVFNEFIQPYLLLALRFIGEVKDDADSKPWGGDRSFTEMMAGWIGDNWGKHC